MPNVNINIHTLLNSVVKQATGSEISQLTVGSFVDLGQSLITSNQVDAIFNVLVDRIGKTAVMNKVYNSKWSSLLKTELQWGAILQRIRIEPIEAMKGEDWEINDQLSVGDLSPYVIHLPKIHQTLFRDFKAYEFGITITRDQMKTAFTSEAVFTAFVEGIYTAVANTVEMYVEKAVKLAVTTFAAIKVLRAGDVKRHAINLLAEYKKENPSSTLTAESAYRDDAFILWTAEYMSNIMDAMRESNTVYSDGDIPTWITSPKIIASTKYVTALNVRVKSSTYNADLIPALNPTITVSGWQANGVDRINLSTDYGPANFKPVALIYDDNAIGATVYNQKSSSIYNERHDYTNLWQHVTCGYFADMAEPAVVFYIADAMTITGDLTSANNPRVSLTLPTGTTSVRVQRSSDGVTWSTRAGTVTTSSWTDTQATAGTYYYRVLPNDGAYSVPSNIVTLTVPTA